MKFKFAIGISLAALAAVFSAAADDDVEVATGRGPRYRDAINEALLCAIEKHYGAAMASEVRMGMSEVQQSAFTTDEGRISGTALRDAISADIKKFTRGKFLGYKVLDESFDGVEGMHRVEVEVRFPGRYVVGRDPNALRRMAVTTFNVRSRSFSWYGQQVDSVEWVAALANELNICLTQTRKFTMLDRNFDSAVNAELARLSSANAAPQDAIRLNQKLGTDYLVVGEATFNDVVAPPVNPYTGRPMPMASALFVEVNYRVLLAPTGQLKWTDTVRLDASQFSASDARSFVSMTAEAAARAICDGMMDDILPFEVTAIKSGMLVIGEGGKQLSVGERFTVCALGDEVADTRTGEVIDVMEIPVATAEIVSVQSKLSYARVIEGDMSQVTVGARLRRIPVPSASEAQTPITTTIKSNGSGGVVVPF